jgi:hypothetical protein
MASGFATPSAELSRLLQRLLRLPDNMRSSMPVVIFVMAVLVAGPVVRWLAGSACSA